MGFKSGCCESCTASGNQALTEKRSIQCAIARCQRAAALWEEKVFSVHWSSIETGCEIHECHFVPDFIEYRISLKQNAYHKEGKVFKKKSTGRLGKLSPFSLGITLFAGALSISSVFAAFLLGRTSLSRRRKEMTESEARLASEALLAKLKDISGQLRGFEDWLKAQDQKITDIKELQHRYAGLKNLYAEWTSHRRIEEVLDTVRHDPKIGMTVSNGLHELRSLNIQLETILRDNLTDSADGFKHFDIVNQHLKQALELFDNLSHPDQAPQ